MVVDFLGFLSGTVSRDHLDWDTDLESAVSKEEEVFCVVSVESESKRIALSRKLVQRDDNLVSELDGAEKMLNRNVEDAVVRRVDQGHGVLLEIPADAPWLAYARSSRTRQQGEDNLIEIDEKYKVGQATTCRVIRYSALTNMFSVSLAKSVIEASVLGYHDVEVGAKVRGTVKTVSDNFVTVALGDSVRGTIPFRHLSDVLVSDVGARFKPGQTLDSLRVLVVDQDKRKLVLTNKRSLVQSDLARITTYQDAFPGMVTHGVVSGSDEKGVFVTFYSNISGRVDKADLLALGIDDPSTVYKVRVFCFVFWLELRTKC